MPIEKSQFFKTEPNGKRIEYYVYCMIPPSSIKDVWTHAEADGLEGPDVRDVRLVIDDLTFDSEDPPREAAIRQANIKRAQAMAAKEGYDITLGFWHSVYIRTIAPEQG